MPSKYAAVLNKLPRLLGSDPRYQEKVEAVKSVIRGNAPRLAGWTGGELAYEYRRLRAKKDWLAKGGYPYPTWIEELAAKLAAADIVDYPRLLAEGIGNEYELNLEIAAYEQLIAEAFEVEGTSSVRLSTDGASISVQPEPYATIEDPTAYRAWCMADEDLRNEMSLPWSTTNAITKRFLLAGESEPPGVKVWMKNKIVMRKG